MVLISGKIVVLFESKYVIGIMDEIRGVFVLVYIGLDIVGLNGRGFMVYVKLN